MIQQGINVILKVDNKVVGGQRNIQLNRSSNAIDITNKINSELVSYKAMKDTLQIAKESK